MIQTFVINTRGEREDLTQDDPRYWSGPWKYVPYPKALYRQTQPGQAPESRVVQNEHEHQRLGSDWDELPETAKEAFGRLEADIAKAAAERTYADSRMSASAQQEALARDRATDEMQPELKAQPVRKRRGRPVTVKGLAPVES